MTVANPWFVAALAGVFLLYHLELLATLLNLAQFRKPLPPLLAQLYDQERLERCQDYHRRSAQTEMTRSSTLLVLLVLFWWLGGFSYLDVWSRGFDWSPVWTGVLVIGLLMLVQNLLSLPFDLWDTFRVETEFEFNRTTPRTFLHDRLKSLLLGIVLGLPLLALVLWFFTTQVWAAAYAWASVTAFSLLLAWASPRLILPLFLKFDPLPEGPLKKAILDLAQKLHFPVAEVSVVDGSRRSSKANAFFAGFGRHKRIALYDTLIQSHTQEELLAVLAHEIGHHRRGHVPRQIAIGLIESAVMFGLLHWALHSPGLFAAFGVNGQPVGLGLVFFGILYRPVALLTGLFSNALSRKHEFEADAYAREALGSPSPLSAALKKLSSDHLAHPQPHPLAVRLSYSHPPLAERLNVLNAKSV